VCWKRWSDAAVIGDGSDNKEASERLGISRYTVLTHRESIMRKLDLHHSRELMQYALVHGYVVITAKGIYRPGFQRRLGFGERGRETGSNAGGRLRASHRAAPAVFDQ
jgi:hypothetical protein